MTPTQKRVMQLTKLGWTKADIAWRLNITPSRVTQIRTFFKQEQGA